MDKIPGELEQDLDSQRAFSSIREHWKHWLGTGCVVVLLISVAHGLAEYHLETQGRSVPPSQKIGDSNKPGPYGSTWIEPAPLVAGTYAYWSFEITGASDKDLELTFQDIRIPGRSPETTSSFAVYSSTDRNVDWRTWTLTIPAGQQAFFWIPIQTEIVGSHTLSTLLAWRDDSGASGPPIPAILPRVPVISPLRTFAAHAFKCFVSLLGILGVPMLLAGAGYWFQQRQQDLSHEREAWAEMLPTSHKNNNAYYVPLLGTINKTLKPIWERQRKSESKDALAELRSSFSTRCEGYARSPTRA